MRLDKSNFNLNKIGRSFYAKWQKVSDYVFLSCFKWKREYLKSAIFISAKEGELPKVQDSIEKEGIDINKKVKKDFGVHKHVLPHIAIV